MTRFEVNNYRLITDPDLLRALESLSVGKSEVLDTKRIFIVNDVNKSDFVRELHDNEIDDYRFFEL